MLILVVPKMFLRQCRSTKIFLNLYTTVVDCIFRLYEIHAITRDVCKSYIPSDGMNFVQPKNTKIFE